MYDTIIIGAGAAGLFTGANLIKGRNLILEGKSRAGEKILITGGGMCNITNLNDTEEFISHFGERSKSNFLKPALLNLPTDRTRSYLEDIGLDLLIREDGKVFPESLKAQSLIDTLLREIRSKKGEVYYNKKVQSITVKEDGFTIKTSQGDYESRNLVIATGGASFPNTGSDGSGYKLSKKIGHNIIPIEPALSNVKIAGSPFKGLSGISIRRSSVDFIRKGSTKRYLTKIDDLLFTHQGISGPVILNNSRQISQGDILEFSLISSENRESSREEIVNTLSKSKAFTIQSFLKKLGIPKAVVNYIIESISIDKKKVGDLNKKEIKTLINRLLRTRVEVSSKGGFNSAMVTAGGVDLREINRKTMESKLIPNLYFAGEVLDIDGDTGGYNIQAAFSTGKLVADKLNKS